MDEQNVSGKTGEEPKNRFIFSNDFYEDMPEVSDNKVSFEPVANANFKPLGSSSKTGPMAALFQASMQEKEGNRSNSSVQQASSLDQVVNNDYSTPSSEPDGNVFNFFSHNANTELEDDTKYGPSTVVDEEADPDPALFHLFGGKKKKPEGVEVVHVGNAVVGDDASTTSVPFENTSTESVTEPVVDSSPSFDETPHSMGEPVSDVSPIPLEMPLQGEISPTTTPSEEPVSDVSSVPSEMPLQGEISPMTTPSNPDMPSPFSPEPIASPSESSSIFQGEGEKMVSEPENSKEELVPSEPLDFTAQVIEPREEASTSFAQTSLPQSDSTSENPVSTGESTFFQSLPPKEGPSPLPESNLELSNPVEAVSSLEVAPSSSEKVDDSSLPVEPSSVADSLGDKSFLLKHEVDVPENQIELPKRNLEYTSYYGGEPVEAPKENQFIVNGEPSVEVKNYEPKVDPTKIPDFMSGTVHADDLNIASGVNTELESELIAQRNEEEARRLAENPEQQLYEQLTPMRPTQELVYRAGGKSYIRDIADRKKPLEPEKKVEISQNDILPPPPVEEEEETKAPTSIEEMIESIVGVPNLENFEVKLDPFENPGVKFGFKEKEDKKILAEDEPTNVYDEKTDNFDYDQNFQNVEVVISDLLDQLKEKAKKENKISILARYGEDFCAREYITNPAIGRAEEIKQLILILLTPEKSGILVGKPGIGKTSIVEGLAYQLQRNNVPDALRGYRIVSVKTPSLLGSLPSGETRLQTLVDELKDLDKVILFIDEIHMLIGATSDSAMDFANMFKESLGRGTIKVIGATTTEEYERYILRDKAFVRRFQRVDVEEPNREQTIKILMGTFPKIEHSTGAKLKYSHYMQSEIMGFIVDITTEYKRIYGIGSRYPDICLTLLAQAFSQAVFANRKEVNIIDIRKAIENSKNIYPDVIKKELVNFDIKFKDLIREEELG